jgi:hypothetical protein
MITNKIPSAKIDQKNRKGILKGLPPFLTIFFFFLFKTIRAEFVVPQQYQH